VILPAWSNRPRIVRANVSTLALPLSNPRVDLSVLAASLSCCASIRCASRSALRISDS
jgi:hypothetical protein